jgi:methionyl-tRNA formyltransferase
VTYKDNNLRIGWIGFHMEGLSAIKELINQNVEINAIITLNEEGLSKRSASSNEYDCISKIYGIPLYKVSNINNVDSVKLLKKLDLDIVFVLGWSQIIRSEALASVRLGMIGAHASILPHNRGSAPINWAIINGEIETGNTLIWLDEEVDTGDVIDQAIFPITPYDTCFTLYEKVASSNKDMILKLIPDLINGKYPRATQKLSNEPILPRRKPSDGLIDWSKTSNEIYNFIRALTKPYPGAFSYLGNIRYNIWNCSLLPDYPNTIYSPGEVIGAVVSPNSNACGQLVSCGEGAIIILELEDSEGQMLNGSSLSNKNWKGEVFDNGNPILY